MDAPAPQRYRLTLAYDGHRFHGWQRQTDPKGNVLRTVQGEVEAALARLCGQPIHVIGASRTDAGVHAKGQVAHFDAVCRVPIENLAHALTGRLPPDIDVVRAAMAPPDFHAIRDAKRKEYRYTIHNARTRPLWLRSRVHHFWEPLDAGRMNDAAARLVGEHDFEGFASAGHGRESTVRTIFACDATRDGDTVTIRVEGNGFLYNMVRILGGTLVEVGRGHCPPEVIDRVLASRNRADAGPTLPPEGLCLEWIDYGDTGVPTSVGMPPQ